MAQLPQLSISIALKYKSSTKKIVNFLTINNFSSYPSGTKLTLFGTQPSPFSATLAKTMEVDPSHWLAGGGRTQPSSLLMQ